MTDGSSFFGTGQLSGFSGVYKIYNISPEDVPQDFVDFADAVFKLYPEEWTPAFVYQMQHPCSVDSLIGNVPK